ncbi:MAG: hypothetical protein WAM62_06115 [Pseudolabrys sp.]
MPIILNATGIAYRLYTYANEATFEKDVVSLADHIFGSSSIYLDIKKKIGNDIVTIPDGYVIDTTRPDEPKLFVVENEIVGHDPFKHVGIQMLKFVTSFDESQRAVRTFLMKEIQKEPKLIKRLETACKKSSSPNIDNFLDRAVYSDFKGLVIIDEETPELNRVLEKINANISVLELKAYISDSGERIFQFDTLYDELEEAPEIDTADAISNTPEARAVRRERRAQSDTVVVPAREEGFQEVFIGENQWRAIRIGAAMKDRIKFIAAYRVAPVQAITHLAKVLEIKPYKDTGKYQLIFDGPAKQIKPIKLKEGEAAPQGPFYVRHEKLLTANTVDEALK